MDRDIKSDHYSSPTYIEEFGKTILPLHSAQILPSLTNPTFTSISTTTQTHDFDDVLGIHFDQISRAYPTWIMDNYHIVNDLFGDTAVLVIH